MSADLYVVWFAGMAVMILLILGTGTLVMSGTIGRKRRSSTRAVIARRLVAHEGGRHQEPDPVDHAA
ncbi:hypothetical protein F0U44_07885 [Nocardioides humilatus]|uniref:Uncharacterized protein n=1 Tax=Nocardioides humilatus TaxID=2607660 RepID=A0A5B1LIV1_9ACTN|nr:hypothetical protein [Nocardioides humilatus]KAA1420324.1 hypothetical protein F0U44_07885 [Nocardioides humilatus]